MRVKEESEKACWKLRIKTTKIIASGPITSWQIEGENMEAVTYFLFLCSKITVDDDCSNEIRSWLFLGRKAVTNLDGVLKSKDITLLTKVLIVQAMVFSVVICRCESWTIKKAGHWRIDVFKLWCWKSLDSALESMEIKLVNLKGNKPWTCFRRTDAEAKDSIFWLPDANSWCIGKGPDVGKDWRQKEKRETEDEMVGWHHWFTGHELSQSLEDGVRQRSLVYCSPRGSKSGCNVVTEQHQHIFGRCMEIC